MDLAQLQQTAWDIAESKGLHDNLDTLPAREASLIRLALVHTEVSEATQVVKRHGVEALEHLRAVGEELADVLIRVADLAQCLGIDLAMEVDHKLATNRGRPQQYGTPWEEGKTAPAESLLPAVLAQLREGRYLETHPCGLCAYRCGYAWSAVGLVYDAGCDCTPRQCIERRTSEELADFCTSQRAHIEAWLLEAQP